MKNKIIANRLKEQTTKIFKEFDYKMASMHYENMAYFFIHMDKEM